MNFDKSTFEKLKAQTSHKLRQNEPHISFGVGLAGLLGTVALASKATLKAAPIVREAKADIESTRARLDDTTSDDESLVYRRALGVTLAKHGAAVAKIYAPTLILGTVSTGLLVASHLEMTKRNKALVAALTTTLEAYEMYRKAVSDVIGAEEEAALYSKTTVDLDGRFQTNNPYAVLFDEFSSRWCDSPETNRVFLEAKEAYFNHKLQVRGHVMLSEVLDELGLEQTPISLVTGWLLDGDGDGYISFVDFNIPPDECYALVLDFNVDGTIWDKI